MGAFKGSLHCGGGVDGRGAGAQMCQRRGRNKKVVLTGGFPPPTDRLRMTVFSWRNCCSPAETRRPPSLPPSPRPVAPSSASTKLLTMEIGSERRRRRSISLSLCLCLFLQPNATLRQFSCAAAAAAVEYLAVEGMAAESSGLYHSQLTDILDTLWLTCASFFAPRRQTKGSDSLSWTSVEH